MQRKMATPSGWPFFVVGLVRLDRTTVRQNAPAF